MRSGELQRWISERGTADQVRLSLKDMPAPLRKELLEEALCNPGIFANFLLAKDEAGMDKKTCEDMALVSLCMQSEFLGPVPMNLPGMNGGNAASCNAFASIPMFGVGTNMNRGDKRPHIGQLELLSRGGIKVKYDGYQLYQSDWDVLACLINAAREDFRQKYVVSARSILRMMNLEGSGQNILMVQETVARLHKAFICVQTTGERTFQIGARKVRDFQKDFQLVKDLTWIDGLINFELDSRLIWLYKNCGYGLIDWKQRVKLKGNELAKLLQLYFSQSADNRQFHKVSRIKNCTTLKGDMKHFTSQMHAALKVLLKTGVIQAYWLSKPRRGEADDKTLCIWRHTLPAAGDIPKGRGDLIERPACEVMDD